MLHLWLQADESGDVQLMSAPDGGFPKNRGGRLDDGHDQPVTVRPVDAGRLIRESPP